MCRVASVTDLILPLPLSADPTEEQRSVLACVGQPAAAGSGPRVRVQRCQSFKNIISHFCHRNKNIINIRVENASRNTRDRIIVFSLTPDSRHICTIALSRNLPEHSLTHYPPTPDCSSLSLISFASRGSHARRAPPPDVARWEHGGS